jgi:hypothetical protein
MPATVAVTKKSTPAPRVTATRRSVPKSRVESTPSAPPASPAPQVALSAQALSVAPVETKKETSQVKVQAKAQTKAAPVPQAQAQAPTPTPQAQATKSPTTKVQVQAKNQISSTVSVTETETASEPVTETETASEPVKVHVDAKKRRQRPRIRPYSEVFAQVYEDINTAYKALQTATRALKSLESAHNREVHNTRSRTNTQRTPTIVFDQDLVNYFVGRLDPGELTVTRKEQEGDVTVDLSDLSIDKRVHRTDVTQLYNKAFVKHGLRDGNDRRFILYQNDPELVALLTRGYTEPKPDLQEEIKQILDGTYRLNIFNIQRFTSQHLGKVELSSKESKSETTSEASQ